MAKVVRTALRSLDGFSLAAAHTLLTRGPESARKVIGETLRAANAPREHHVVDLFDLMRAFAVDETLVFNGSSWIDGCTAPHERFLLALLVRFFRPKTLVEVGTYRGATTRLLLDHLPSEATLYTIDLPPGCDFAADRAATDEHLIVNREVGAEYHGHAKAQSAIQILGNTFDLSTWQQIPEGIEFAFIDAGHSYEAVRNDTEMVRRKSAAGAVIVWHDYYEGDPSEAGEYGVGKYIREEMRVRQDVFIAIGTTLGIQIPVPALLEAEKRIPRFFPSGDCFVRRPNGAFPWLHRPRLQF